MNQKLKNLILSHTHSTRILREEKLQSLWGGYGQIVRIHLDNTSVILKLIKFPQHSDHPRGWNTNLSHKRKVKSYEVESCWYQKYNHEDQHFYSPRCLAAGEIQEEKFLLLADLKQKSFQPHEKISWNQVKHCLSWLAHFHRFYLHKKPEDLWPVGTYWHLATRPDELQTLQDLELKNAAHAIDRKLNSAHYQTFVHGDAKVANFLFNQDSAAAVDFQYVGGGVGIKDVAYFLSSVYNEQQLETLAEQCLNYYFAQLDHTHAEQEWRELYPYAWCDFYRFLQGWSPGHYKVNSYSTKIKDQVLSWL